MKYVRTASVKMILTADKKNELEQSFQRNLTQVTTEMKQMEFQLQRALKTVKSNRESSGIHDKYKKELQRREEKRKSLEFQLTQLSALSIGTEISSGKTEVLLDLTVGDRWVTNETDITVVVKDGKILEIRESEFLNDGKLV
ncbi:hypothetical protein JOC54_000850 [Alkalihalobacillus xiaoxiensis]|uniref:YlqD protein n=1 Tax=Shouchella xiaoxiensis TaxID=766895 RepID=A0ABS2SQ27_9BACI|nr:YlqD family protein [Shouchella xiaoxiensis]MBM7837619.1 hypothetical protein [Shouchella xiaoxiensis]